MAKLCFCNWPNCSKMIKISLFFRSKGLAKSVKDQEFYASKPLHLKAEGEGEITNGQTSPGVEPRSKKPKADAKQ